MKCTEEELNTLFKEYADKGDTLARDKIIEHFLYLARAVASKFTGRGVEFDDLFQVASLAMLKSIDRYDYKSGIKFTTYATPCMIGEIKNYFRDKSRAIRLSRRDSEQLVTLSDIMAHSSCEEDLMPEVIANKMGVSVERVLELLEMRSNANVTSLDATTDDDDDAISNFIGKQDSGFDEMVTKDFINRAMKKLNDDERKVIYLRFWKNFSQKQTAEKIGVSQMTVSRLERKAISKLNDEYFSD